MPDRREVATTIEDSELGRWTFADWRPSPGDPLFDSVARIWYFDGATAHAFERVFPDGTFEIIVQLDERYRPAGSDVPFPALGFDGLRLQAFTIEAPGGRCRVLGMRLHAVGAFAVLAQPIAQTAGRSLDLADLVGHAARELGERCHAARHAADVVRCAAAWTTERVMRSNRVDAGLGWIVERISNTHGGASMTALCDRLGRDPSRVARAFREQIGVTPKRFARIVRFDTVARLLAGGVDLAEASDRAGYYDQSHMTAEFGVHAGMTPRAYVLGTHYPASLSLAEDA